MFFLKAIQFVSTLLAVAAGVSSSKLPDDHILWGRGGKPTTLAKRVPVATPAPVPATADGACTNGPLTRQCWNGGYSINDDFDLKWPTTGVTRKYNFVITNTTCAPDGITRTCSLINGQYPGPTIFADWGDMIEVTVTNKLENNGTGIHWHGIRQLNTNTMDGVPGLTECPLAPGDTKTYTFQATQYGTSWYHSHYTVQYGDGVVGTIQINGPASANYDLDLGVYPVSDWMSHETAFQFLDNANVTLQLGQGPAPQDNILINGTNVSLNGTGAYNKVSLTPGKKHRLRLINIASESAIRVSLDNHTMEVIATDFVPVKPFMTNTLLMAIGQRYDVVITASQAAGNYWFRADVATDCSSAVNNNGKAIFTYSGFTVAQPTTTEYTEPTNCSEPTSITPYWPSTLPSSDFQSQLQAMDVNLGIPNVTTNNQNVVSWIVNLTAIDINWRDPTLQYVAQNDTNYPKTYNMIEIPNEGTWSYWVIQEPANSPVEIPHPIHLHGHDFWILGRGDGIFDPTSNFTSLNFNNPPRRDVTLLPGGGWVVLAFPADNPGAWLMHCHISSHISAGLGVQFLESKDKIKLGDAAWEETCTNWATYYKSVNVLYDQDDSGL